MGAHRSFDEQLQGGESHRLLAIETARRRRAIEGFQTLHELALSAQTFAAGGQNVYLRRAAQKALDEQRHGIDEVLAVIDHQQHLPLAQIVDHTRQRRAVVYCQIEQGRQL